MRETTARAIETVTADAGYAYAKVFGGLERRRNDPVIPTRKDPSRSPVPVRRVRYDARYRLVKCPHGKILHPVRCLGRGQVFLSREPEEPVGRPRIDWKLITDLPGRRTNQTTILGFRIAAS